MMWGADSLARSLWMAAGSSEEGDKPTTQLMQVWIPLRFVNEQMQAAENVQPLANQRVRCRMYLHIHDTHRNSAEDISTLALARRREDVNVGLTLDETLDRLEWSECGS